MKRRFPELRIQRERGRSDRFYIWLPAAEGRPRKKIFFGPVTDPASRAKYEAMRDEWTGEGGRRSEAERIAERSGGPIVATLINSFMDWARDYYQRDGEPTGTAANYWISIKPFLMRHGAKLCAEISLDDLEAYQRELDGGGNLCRAEVNKRVSRVINVIRWGVSHRINGERYVPPEVARDAALLRPIRRGRGNSRENPRRLAANVADVEKTIPYLPRSIRPIVRLLIFTGARPGEIRSVRPCDINQIAPDLWEYRPEHYKTERFGVERVIYFGPRSIAVLTEALAEFKGAPTDYLFFPRNKTGKKYGQQQFSHAIRDACDAAGVPRWTAYQIRKARATEIDRDLGVEAAAAVLGHRTTRTTDRYYIDPRTAKAAEIARKFG